MNKKIYKKLKEIAKRQETITYSQFASDCNIPYSDVDERNLFHHMLGDISEFEVKEGRPMLSVLVHHKGDVLRTPGPGWFNLADKLGQRKVGEPDLNLKNRIIKECWAYWREK
jgi:hypothetical protein